MAAPHLKLPFVNIHWVAQDSIAEYYLIFFLIKIIFDKQPRTRATQGL